MEKKLIIANDGAFSQKGDRAGKSCARAERARVRVKRTRSRTRNEIFFVPNFLRPARATRAYRARYFIWIIQKHIQLIFDILYSTCLIYGFNLILIQFSLFECANFGFHLFNATLHTLA